MAGFSKITIPLTQLLKKDVKWWWTPARQAAFDRLKEALTSAPILALPDFTKEFEVQTDASEYALGGVLLQDNHPVAYESRKLKPAERNYPAHDKEMVAVIHCLRVWRHYLLGEVFVVKIDNISNTFFKTSSKLSHKKA